MRAALEDGAAVVLFPSDDAAPASELAGPVDVVVIDGTWEQAQKLNARLPGRRAKLDEHIVDELASKGPPAAVPPDGRAASACRRFSPLRHMGPSGESPLGGPDGYSILLCGTGEKPGSEQVFRLL